MKKLVTLSIVGIFLLVGCGPKSKEAELQGFFEEMIQVQEKYAEELKKVSNADEMVAFTQKYTDAIILLGKKGKEMEKKFEDAKEDAAFSKEMEKYEKRMETALMKTMQASQQAMMKYMSDPKVRKAQIEMMKKISKALGDEQ